MSPSRWVTGAVLAVLVIAAVLLWRPWSRPSAPTDQQRLASIPGVDRVVDADGTWQVHVDRGTSARRLELIVRSVPDDLRDSSLSLSIDGSPAETPIAGDVVDWPRESAVLLYAIAHSPTVAGVGPSGVYDLEYVDIFTRGSPVAAAHEVVATMDEPGVTFALGLKVHRSDSDAGDGDAGDGSVLDLECDAPSEAMSALSRLARVIDPGRVLDGQIDDDGGACAPADLEVSVDDEGSLAGTRRRLAEALPQTWIQLRVDATTVAPGVDVGDAVTVRRLLRPIGITPTDMSAGSWQLDVTSPDALAALVPRLDRLRAIGGSRLELVLQFGAPEFRQGIGHARMSGTIGRLQSQLPFYVRLFRAGYVASIDQRGAIISPALTASPEDLSRADVRQDLVSVLADHRWPHPTTVVIWGLGEAPEPGRTSGVLVADILPSGRLRPDRRAIRYENTDGYTPAMNDVVSTWNDRVD